jgi:predicted GNAT superfamily acetyltransferase
VADEPIPISTEVEEAVLALNNAHAVELSWLEREQLRVLLRQAFYARRIADVDAFLMAFDERAGYDSPNYLWFRARYPRFVYIDRVVVAPSARGRGLARALYADLFDRAGRADHYLVVCEVNITPPNLASDALHAVLGSSEVGQATIHSGTKTVRYLSRPLVRPGRTFSS